MHLRELLAVPYLLEAEVVEREPGHWLIRLAYPELPGCAAEGAVVEHALRDLERRRIEIIVGLVEQGRQPPIPRQPLATSDPLWTVRDLGLSERVAPLLTAANPKRRPDAFDSNGDLSCSHMKTMSGW